MMDDDARMAALFGPAGDIPDDGFSGRVLALAALETQLAARRRAQFARVAAEAAGLAAVLGALALLGRLTPASEIVPIGSPAMIGLVLLATWLSVGMRGAVRA